MKTYKIEILLELNEEQSLEWVFQAIRDLLEDGETIQSGRSLEIEKAEDNDIIECPHCNEKTHICSLIGKNTNNCPRCGKQALFNKVEA